MKNQALFSSKDKSKKLKCRLLQFLFSALRVKTYSNYSSCSVLNSLVYIFERENLNNASFILWTDL